MQGREGAAICPNPPRGWRRCTRLTILRFELKVPGNSYDSDSGCTGAVRGGAGLGLVGSDVRGREHCQTWRPYRFGQHAVWRCPQSVRSHFVVVWHQLPLCRSVRFGGLRILDRCAHQSHLGRICRQPAGNIMILAEIAHCQSEDIVRLSIDIEYIDDLLH